MDFGKHTWRLFTIDQCTHEQLRGHTFLVRHQAMSNAAQLAAMLKETASIGSAFSGKLPILIRVMKALDLKTWLWQFLLVRRMDDNEQ
jgi:hypothetical protein